jgi:hypothetical protein
MLLFAFSHAFCGANWVARVEISDHGNVRARVGMFKPVVRGVTKA